MAADIVEEEYNCLKEENNRYRQLISQLKNQLVSLGKEIDATESRIKEKAAVPGGIIEHRSRHRRHNNRIRLLENKLNQDTMKLNQMMSCNTHYRRKIAYLHEHKVRGCKLELKLKRHLAAQQSTMEELQERLSNAVTRRSKAETQIQELGKSTGEGTQDFINKKMELQHAAKVHIFMETKLRDTVLMEEDNDSKKSENQLHHQDEASSNLQAYSTLVETTGKTDPGQIGHMISQTEQRNFAYINYISEQHNRKNNLNRCINKRKSDIQFLQQENQQRDELHRIQMQELESELERYSCLADCLEEQCVAVQTVLEPLMASISSFFAELMQNSITVLADNVVHVIGLLEEKIVDLLIEAIKIEYAETGEFPQKPPLANFDLLPKVETAVERVSRKSTARSLKSAGSEGK